MGPPLLDSQGELEPSFEISFEGGTLSCTSLYYLLYGLDFMWIMGLGLCTLYFQFMGTYFQV